LHRILRGVNFLDDNSYSSPDAALPEEIDPGDA
jgi:hypothetical protein